MKCLVTAIYETRTTANKAMSDLEKAGFPRTSMQLVIPVNSREAYYSHKASAALWGGGTGAVLAGLSSIASAPPGLFGVAPVLTMFVGCAAGAALGGLAGLLFERGVAGRRTMGKTRAAPKHPKLVGPKRVVLQVETTAPRQAEEAERILLGTHTLSGGTALSVTRGASQFLCLFDV